MNYEISAAPCRHLSEHRPMQAQHLMHWHSASHNKLGCTQLHVRQCACHACQWNSVVGAYPVFQLLADLIMLEHNHTVIYHNTAHTLVAHRSTEIQGPEPQLIWGDCLCIGMAWLFGYNDSLCVLVSNSPLPACCSSVKAACLVAVLGLCLPWVTPWREKGQSGYRVDTQLANEPPT